MPGWTLVDTHPTQGRTFQRPLDVWEHAFFWDGVFNGTTDTLQHSEIRLINSSRDAHLFSEANIVKAWVSTKRRYPLAGATVRESSIPIQAHLKEAPGFASEPHFVVQEHDLTVLRPREIVFGQVTCAEEVQQQVAAILDGPRPLSEDLLVQLYVFHETDSERTDVLHLMLLMAHCVTDGTANNTFMRCLLDTLARGGETGSELAQIPLEERLVMTIPSMDLEPMHLRSLSPARRRWRRAAGLVILQLRMAKRQGGHTLPCRLTRSTPYILARSGRVSTSLTGAQTASVIANCHSHNVTFGNAYLALAQVAMTRVLYRRYLRGEISEEEWAYRKRQPHLTEGPFKLRSYLDKAWFEGGGGGEFMLSIGLFHYELPFMTLGTTAERYGRRNQFSEYVLSDGAPSFSELLTFDRFLHRAGLVKKQAIAFFGHPLFYEIVRAVGLARIDPMRVLALQWMKGIGTANGDDTQGNSNDDEVVGVTEMPMVWAHGGSSLGNLDLISPTAYPLPPTHTLSPYSSTPHPARAGYSAPPPAFETDTTPKIMVANTKVHLHTHPAELYLGAASSYGCMDMYVQYDSNVFEDGIVKEWLDEVKGAVLWYLGQTHQSRGAHQSRGGLSRDRVARGEDVQPQAKL